ncbi:MAG: ATP-binding cassette domain-containing protein [Candidatus Hodarchaeales archaeon]
MSINYDKCKPDLCGYACEKYCPLVMKGQKNVVTIRKDTGKPIINNRTCLMARKGTCGICINKCFPRALSVTNLPDIDTAGLLVHCYDENGFRFFGVPQIHPGKVIGLLGVNGIGKSTILNILAGQKPNGGNFNNPKKGFSEFYSELRIASFRQLLHDLGTEAVRVAFKPQIFSHLLQKTQSVSEMLSSSKERGGYPLSEVVDLMELEPILLRPPQELSGGELQRLAIGLVLVKEADIYLIDEPCTFLDFRQRIKIAKIFHELASSGKTVFIAEHDIAVLDFQSDLISLG